MPLTGVLACSGEEDRRVCGFDLRFVALLCAQLGEKTCGPLGSGRVVPQKRACAPASSRRSPWATGP